jgi:hypothetical protein
MRTRTVPACAERASSEPSADEMPRTGIPIPGPDERGGDGCGAPRHAFVGDQNRACSGRLGVAGLLEHEALPAPQERDGPLREAGEVGRLAATRGRVELDGHDLSGDGTAARIAQRDEVPPKPVGGGSRGETFEAGRTGLPKEVEGERPEPRPVPGRSKLPRHVGNRLLVSGRAGVARPVVAAGDRGQRDEMGPQVGWGDGAGESVRTGGGTRSCLGLPPSGRAPGSRNEQSREPEHDAESSHVPLPGTVREAES